MTIARKPAHVVIEGHVTRRPELVSVDPDIKDGTVPKLVMRVTLETNVASSVPVALTRRVIT